MGSAYCVKVISGEEFVIDETHPYDGKTWFQMRPSNVIFPVKSYTEFKKFIIKICKKTNKCQEEVSSWDRSLQTIDGKLIEKTGVVPEPVNSEAP